LTTILYANAYKISTSQQNEELKKQLLNKIKDEDWLLKIHNETRLTEISFEEKLIEEMKKKI